jgi:hypothetical protein
MNQSFPVCIAENRHLDGYDLISVLGLMKEYNTQEIWRRYLSEGSTGADVSMYVETDHYFIEMHVQEMHRIILSEKFNTNPFFMQQVVQRVTAGHNHELVLDKIQRQGIDTGDDPISLSCSMGNTIMDLLINKKEPFSQSTSGPAGETFIETEEKRPLDIYDLSSTLYLCRQNMTEKIFRRYSGNGFMEIIGQNQPEVNIRTIVGRYSVLLNFHCIDNRSTLTIYPPGNASAATMHQVLERMNFRHTTTLIAKELDSVGLRVTGEQLEKDFILQRFINNTALSISFKLN